MTADILRPCPDCGATLVASSTVARTPEMVANGARPFGHTWVHRNPAHDEGCYAIEDGMVEPHPDNLAKINANQSMAQVINVDFKNKKRLD